MCRCCDLCQDSCGEYCNCDCGYIREAIFYFTTATEDKMTFYFCSKCSLEVARLITSDPHKRGIYLLVDGYINFINIDNVTLCKLPHWEKENAAS